MKIKKLICLIVYYGFAKHLPASTNPLTHWARKVRRVICYSIFDYCGENVMMGPDVTILTQTHNIDRTDIPMGHQGMRVAEVTIGNDVWIGR